MKIEGKLTPPRGSKNKYWCVEIPLLEIYTQGESKSDAYFMAKDAVETLVAKKGFKMICAPGKGNRFMLTANDPVTFVAFILGRLRVAHNLTARQMAERLQSSSPNAYARYEQGRTIPKLDTLEELLRAIDPSLGLVLVAG
ncbi:MAG: helix-turn-helix transcriptional regulator [Deltaproteobacteria bacterium]|nr:helix-turn-helix transcriptional regulator [Deltaproteobacteria bacterium]